VSFYSPSAEEWPRGDRDGVCDDIIKGLEIVMTLSIAEAFSTPVDLNVYPAYAISVEYPIDISTIKVTKSNNYCSQKLNIYRASKAIIIINCLKDYGKLNGFKLLIVFRQDWKTDFTED